MTVPSNIRTILAFFLTAAILVFAGTGSAAAQALQPLRLVSAPTAGTLPAKSYSLETHLFDGGGVAQRISVGVTDLLDIGVSFSGAGIVGSRPVVWQPHAGAQVRVRIIEESMSSPGVALGFDSQGEGQYLPSRGRFRQKAKGVYLAVSRNYRLLGDIGFHGGVNYSFEDEDDSDPSFWVGIDKSLGPSLDVCGEYDFATNDNDDRSMTANRGYLNAAVRFRLNGVFTLEVNLRNILQNEKALPDGSSSDKPEPARELRFSYNAWF